MTKKSESRILLTGSSGFIGGHLKKIGRTLGLNITTLDMAGSPDIKSDIRFTNWDSIGLSDYDFVIHLAAMTSVPESIENPEVYFEVNSKATESLFQACLKNRVKRVIFASSAAVYGTSSKKVMRIGEEGELSSTYAITKLQGEKIAKALSSPESKFVCLRLFNVYGPHQRINGDYSAVIPSFIHQVISGKMIEIHGDGNQTRDFIHVYDVSKAIISSLTAHLPDFSIINVGSGTGTSIIDLANAISEIFSQSGKEPAVIQFTHSRVGDVRDSVADIKGVEALLQIESLIGIEDGLRDLVKRTLDESNA